MTVIDFDPRIIETQALALEQGVLFGKLATEDEVQAKRPTIGADPQLWLQYFGWLHRMHARVEFRHDMERSAEARESLDALVMDALSNKPEQVRRTTPNPDGSPRYVHVYPKSLVALRWITAQDRLLEWHAQHIELLARVPALDAMPEDLATFERVVASQSTELLRLVAVLCTPGARLNFQPTESGQWAIPDEYLDLDPVEILAVHAAHTRVNYHRLNALRLLIASDATDSESDIASSLRASWSVFYGVASLELGVQPSVLAADWAVGEVLAAFRLSGAAKREAMKRPPTESDHG